jgi:hypothetical protein
MQHDCNLVLYDQGQVIWDTKTQGRGSACRLTLLNNGNLAIWDWDTPLDKPIWQTGTSGEVGNYVLALQQDRNVVIYGLAVWSTNTVGVNVDATAEQVIISAAAGAMVALPSAAPGDNILTSPNSLLSDQALTTGYYSFVMQEDCNLVLYDAGRPIWHSKTAGKGFRGCHLTLHNNGNLVVYNKGNGIMWQSGTNGKNDHYVLVLQEDRNVVIYGPAIWATGTKKPAVGVTAGPHNATASVDAAAEQVIISAAARALLK